MASRPGSVSFRPNASRPSARQDRCGDPGARQPAMPRLRGWSRCRGGHRRSPRKGRYPRRAGRWRRRGSAVRSPSSQERPCPGPAREGCALPGEAVSLCRRIPGKEGGGGDRPAQLTPEGTTGKAIMAHGARKFSAIGGGEGRERHALDKAGRAAGPGTRRRAINTASRTGRRSGRWFRESPLWVASPTFRPVAMPQSGSGDAASAPIASAGSQRGIRRPTRASRITGSMPITTMISAAMEASS